MKPSVTKQRHLSHAKRDIAAGTASFRSAATHIAAAVKAGATQAEAAAKVGKSQPWVNRLLRWREGGFKADGPFAEDHARAIISGANNPATVTVPMVITYDATAPREVALEITRGGPPLGEVTRRYDDLGEVTRGFGLREVKHESGPLEVTPMSLLVKLETLEKQVVDLSMDVQQYGGIVAVGKAVEKRIMAVVNRHWSLAEHPAVRRGPV